jgi:hypothetical protein
MPWVTFGYAGTAGMAVTVRANMKDENYFANAASLGRQEPAPPKAIDGRIGKSGGWGGLFHELKGEPSPPGNPKARMGERLLFFAGKSPLAQLSERHLAAHRLAIGLA